MISAVKWHFQVYGWSSEICVLLLLQTTYGQRFILPLSVAGCTATRVRMSVISLYSMKWAGERNSLISWHSPVNRLDFTGFVALMKFLKCCCSCSVSLIDCNHTQAHFVSFIPFFHGHLLPGANILEVDVYIYNTDSFRSFAYSMICFCFTFV